MDERAAPFDVPRFRDLAALCRLNWGEPVIWSSVTGSTNQDALAAARGGAPQGALFGADLQTLGRGRRGHVWFSRPEENLLFSLLLRPTLSLERVSSFTLAVGLAVRDALAPAIQAPVRLKWPNDIWIEERKVCGILLESQIDRGKLSALVVGIGLNVLSREFPPELRQRATSLWLAGSSELGREAWLVELLAALERRTAQFLEQGVAGLEADLRMHDALFARTVAVDGEVGVAGGIDAEGRLILRTPAGTERHLAAGGVELIG